MSGNDYSVIYTPATGKAKPRLARAGGYLDLSKDADAKNEKALADAQSESMMSSVGIMMGVSWKYVNTEFIQKRWLHHYKHDNGDHVWVAAEEVS